MVTDAGQGEEAGGAGVAVASSAPRSPRRRRWPWALLTVAVLFLVIVGPWPSDNSPFTGSTYQATTLARLALAKPAVATGPLSVGYATLDISTPLGHSLAGFSRHDFAAVAVDAPVFARALTLAVGDVKTTILTVDLLMIDETMRDAILARTGLAFGDIYFTSSHTHSGPGGWGHHPVERIITGSFDQTYFDHLADQLARTILESRKRQNLTPASVATVSVETSDGQLNRLAPGEPTFDQLAAIVIKPHNGDPPLVLASYGAHATVVPGDPPILSPDYPGALVARLDEIAGVRSMFACGAVGDTSPQRPAAPSPVESAHILGHHLADQLAPALAQAALVDEVTLASLDLRVDLPQLRFALNADWSLSPVVTVWLSDRTTHVHVLRIGDTVLTGFPGDYAGHLATPLAREARRLDLKLIPTSFSGEYKGYLVSRDIYMTKSAYETRDMNFYGPWAGEYLTDTALRMIQRLADTRAD